MKATPFAQMECPIARGLDEVGEWWSILILRDAFHGLTRFDAFQASLGVATSTLARRLNALVDDGLLERRRYCDRPPRDEYVLTNKGRDFYPVLLALMAWGNRHAAGERGPAVIAQDRATGAILDPVLVDRRTREPLSPATVRLSAGPGAGPEIHNRLAQVEAMRGGPSGSADGAGYEREDASR